MYSENLLIYKDLLPNVSSYHEFYDHFQFFSPRMSGILNEYIYEAYISVS